MAPLSSSTWKASDTASNRQAIQASVKNCGILNKGNTGYIIAILQFHSTMEEFWSSFNAVSKTLSPFVSSFVKMSLSKPSQTAIDPCQFLRFLKQVLVKSERPHFNIFEQQDARKILACILYELCGDFILVQVKTRVTMDSLSCLTASGSKHSAVFFRFIFITRTSLRRQFFFL